MTAQPDTPAELQPADIDLARLTTLAGSLKLPFITVHLVRRAEGVWRVLEAGDGQVSDRPATTTAGAFVAAILAAAE